MENTTAFGSDSFTMLEPRLSVLVPTYMEAENLPELVERIEKALNEVPLEIIIIDDNSPDGTANIAEELGRKFGNLRVVRRVRKMGLGSAVSEGLKLARAWLVAVMDADLQHPPEALPQMLKLMESYEVVIASRFTVGGEVKGLNIWRRIMSKGARFLAHVSLPKVRRVADPLSGYFMLNKAVIYGVELNPIGYKILLEILVKGKYTRIFELPYKFEHRAKGESKLGLGEMLCYLKHLCKLVRETK